MREKATRTRAEKKKNPERLEEYVSVRDSARKEKGRTLLA